MAIRKILERARELLTDPGAWHQGCSYCSRRSGLRNPLENGEHSYCEALCRMDTKDWAFCALSMVDRAWAEIASAYAYIDSAALACDCLIPWIGPGFRSVDAYNDHRDTTHADILRLFDAAIASLAAEGL